MSISPTTRSTHQNGDHKTNDSNQKTDKNKEVTELIQQVVTDGNSKSGVNRGMERQRSYTDSEEYLGSNDTEKDVVRKQSKTKKFRSLVKKTFSLDSSSTKSHAVSSPTIIMTFPVSKTSTSTKSIEVLKQELHQSMHNMSQIEFNLKAGFDSERLITNINLAQLHENFRCFNNAKLKPEDFFTFNGQPMHLFSEDSTWNAAKISTAIQKNNWPALIYQAMTFSAWLHVTNELGFCYPGLFLPSATGVPTKLKQGLGVDIRYDEKRGQFSVTQKNLYTFSTSPAPGQARMEIGTFQISFTIKGDTTTNTYKGKISLDQFQLHDGVSKEALEFAVQVFPKTL